MCTKVALVNDLLEKSRSEKRDKLIDRAREGYYHDFQTPLDFPKIKLHTDLLAAGFQDLAAKVRAGEYDDEFGG